LCGLDFPKDENLIVGLDQADDAGVYRITPDLALIQTVDFFTPVVDDPYDFGQIAAANALSDVYAMGGIPKTAMNLVAFPIQQMDISILRRIIQGGLDKIREAGVVLVGGHSIEDKELKYGLSVTGFVHPDRVLTKRGLKPGDRLILTKPLGTGIINTAIKAGLAQPELIAKVTELMAELNQKSADIMSRYPVHACTDITGFGLIGHLAEMVTGTHLGLIINHGELPIIPEAMEFAAMGFVPGGTYKNRQFREAMVEIPASMDRALQDVIYDPQTSGGLLISVSPEAAENLLTELKEKSNGKAAIIGEVSKQSTGKIILI
jgi:selenide, water dikinase